MFHLNKVLSFFLRKFGCENINLKTGKCYV